MHLPKGIHCLLLFICAGLFHPLYAATALVAVAANFAKPMTALAATFEQASGHHIATSLGASGKLVAQIENGAPFEILLSADETGPLQLEQKGLGVSGSRFPYALGTLVLWSATAGVVDDNGAVLQSDRVNHIAIADPSVAPYGVAALMAMQQLGVYPRLQSRLVMGENLAQTLQFVSTGNAEIGFVAASQVFENGQLSSGSVWKVPARLYNPIKQTALLLTHGADNPAAVAFMQFLRTAPALAIIEQYGYGLPE